MNLTKKIGIWISGASAGFFASMLVAYAETKNSMLENPLNSAFSTVPDFISGVLKVVVMIALPIITIFIVFAGFQFLSAQGNFANTIKMGMIWGAIITTTF